jgi:putative DNA primase/helicase
MSAASVANTPQLAAVEQGSHGEEASAGAPKVTLAATIPSRKLGRRRPTNEEARAQFEEFLRECGLRVPEQLDADGEFHRVARADDGEDAKDSDGSATYKLHLDGWPAGGVNDFRGRGFTKWKAKPVEEETFFTSRREPVAEASARAARPDSTVAEARSSDEKAAARAAARERAAAIWAAGTSAPDTHPYLVRKEVQAHGLRVHPRGGALIVPIHRVEDDAMTGLQFIPAEPGADKKYMRHSAPTGAAYRIGHVTDVIAIAEGFATAASVHEATGWTVLVAFTCSNLEPVAVAARARWSEARLVMIGDNVVWKLGDGTTPKNPGEFHARKAARAAAAHLAVAPVKELPNAEETHPTDWNDVARVWAREQVRARLEAALTAPVGVGADVANRPTILVESGTLPAQVRPAMEALRAANETDPDGGYFGRGKDLLRVVRQRTPRVERGVTLQPEVSYLSRVTFPHLYGRLAETVRWLQYDARKRGIVEADPPKIVAQMILAHEGTEAPGRPLVAAITAPTLRPDGTVLDRPGYDEATGLY